MFIITYVTGIFSVICFVLGGFLLYEKRRRSVPFSLSLVILSAGVWAFSNAWADVSFTEPVMIFWSGMAVIGILCFTASFLLFVEYFTGGNQPVPRRRILAYVVPAFVLSLFAFSEWSTTEVVILYTQPTQNGVGPLYIPLALFYYGSFFFAYYKLFRHARVSSPKTRRQIRYVVLGTFCTLVGSAVFNLILPFLGEVRFYSAGPLSTIFMIGFFSYAVIRHNFLDIRIIVQRSIIYFVLLTLIIASYLAILYFAGIFLQRFTELTPLIAGILTTVLGILSVPRIEAYFRRVTDKIFFKGKYDYSETLHALSEITTRNLDMDVLLAEISSALQNIFKTQEVRFVPLVLNSIAPVDGIIIPVGREDRARLSIVMGPKRSGDSYTYEDFRLLQTFSYQLATALEKAELFKKVKDHSLELERRVEERTEELRELQQEQERIMLDISHALQTPITVLKGELESFRKKMPENEKIAVFERSIDRVAKFTYDLLKLARLKGMGAEPVLEPVDMSAIVGGVLEYVATICEAQGITLVQGVAPGVYMVGDRATLEELVTNLISNAIKYTAHSRIRKIVVTLQVVGALVEFVVADTGIGISPEDLPNIFGRFYRMREEKGRSVEGVGLGLAISKRIVEMHGGEIAVASEAGKGATFTVRFPAA